MHDFTAAVLVNQLIEDEEHLEITTVLNEGLPRALPDWKVTWSQCVETIILSSIHNARGDGTLDW